MNRHIVTIKRNGNIEYFNKVIGQWRKRDIWKESHSTNGRDLSGNRIVHYAYAFTLECGYSNDFCYTLEDVRKLAQKKYEEFDDPFAPSNSNEPYYGCDGICPGIPNLAK